MQNFLQNALIVFVSFLVVCFFAAWRFDDHFREAQLQEIALKPKTVEFKVRGVMLTDEWHTGIALRIISKYCGSLRVRCETDRDSFYAFTDDLDRIGFKYKGENNGTYEFHRGPELKKTFWINLRRPPLPEHYVDHDYSRLLAYALIGVLVVMTLIALFSRRKTKAAHAA